MMEYHEPVLLNKSVEGLEIEPNGVYVDVTFGGGGHSKKILEKLGPKGRLIAIDQDQDALNNTIDDSRFTLVHGNFRYLSNYLKYLKIDSVDGILADLGVSSHHFDEGERGFSFQKSSKLDMRMNEASEKDAIVVLNEYSERDLIRVFRTYGEFNHARRLAANIVSKRSESEISSVEHLVEMVEKLVPVQKQNKSLAQVFQAIRIEVNDEVNALIEFLEATPTALKIGGLLVVISYHSLEDRLAKYFIRSGNINGEQHKDSFGNILTPFKVLTRKVVVPDDEEIKRNSRAKSAKLRIARRIEE